MHGKLHIDFIWIEGRISLLDISCCIVILTVSIRLLLSIQMRERRRIIVRDLICTSQGMGADKGGLQ